MNKIVLSLVAVFYVALLGVIFKNYFSGNVAGSTDSISAVVALGYCGDGIVGDGEDCDGSNLNGKGCGNMNGYNYGTLICDNSCSFNTSGCGYVAPTNVPTNVPTDIPTSVPTSIPTNIPTTVLSEAKPTIKNLALAKISVTTVPIVKITTVEEISATPTLIPTIKSQKEVAAVENYEEESFFEKPVVKKVSIFLVITAFVGGLISGIVKVVKYKKVPAFILAILKWFRF